MTRAATLQPTLARLELDLAVDGSKCARSRRSDSRAARELDVHVRAYVAALNHATTEGI